MKKWMALVLAAVCLMSIAGCGRTMDYIIANEPSVTGIVEEVHDKYILIHIETDGYPQWSGLRSFLGCREQRQYDPFQCWR